MAVIEAAHRRKRLFNVLLLSTDLDNCADIDACQTVQGDQKTWTRF